MSDTPTRTALAPSDLPATYTVRDIARLTQSSERHIRRLDEHGRIPGRIKGFGRLIRFSKSAVDAWLKSGGGPAQQAEVGSPPESL